MATNGEVRSERVIPMNDAGAAAIVALAADIKAAVDQLEIDCRAQRIGGQTAAQIHELRERAERIFRSLE